MTGNEYRERSGEDPYLESHWDVYQSNQDSLITIRNDTFFTPEGAREFAHAILEVLDDRW